MIDKVPMMANGAQAGAVPSVAVETSKEALGLVEVLPPEELRNVVAAATWRIEKTNPNIGGEVLTDPVGASAVEPNPTNLNEQKTTILNERSAEPNTICTTATTTTTLKREKSHTDTLERKKKRVKFTCDEEGSENEVIVKTHVFEDLNPIEALIRDSDIVSNTPLAKKLKRMLKNKSKHSELERKTSNDLNTNITCNKDVPEDSSLNDISGGKNPQDDVVVERSFNNGASEITFIDEDSDSQSENSVVPNSNDEDTPEFKELENDSDTNSLKRERTFTTDDNPPAKAPKISDKSEEGQNRSIQVSNSEDHPNIESTEEVMVNYVEGNCPNDSETESCARGEPKDDVIVKNSFLDIPTKNKTVELKLNSTASKRRAKVNVEKSIKPDRAATSDSEDEYRNEKAKCGSFRDSAKKTLINAWKSALKTSGSESFPKAPGKEKGTPVNITKENEEELVKIAETSDVGIGPKKTRTSGQKAVGEIPTKNDSVACTPKDTVPKSVKAKQCVKEKETPHRNDKQQGKLVGTVLPFRRDGTFTKKSRLQFDNERARFEAEIRKLSSENTRLQSEVTEARHWAEGEEAARKAMRREHLQRIRQVKEEEHKKKELAVAEIKNRLDEEHREALTQQKITQRKGSEQQLQRLEREHGEEVKRVRQEGRQEVERARQEARKEGGRSPDTARPSSKQMTVKEQEKLSTEVLSLRAGKKRLELTVQKLQEIEKDRNAEIRKLQSDHEMTMNGFLKTARQEQAKMMEEMKSRERTVALLERQLQQTTGKMEQLLEVNRSKAADKQDDARKPLVRSNSSPARQYSKNSNHKNSSNNNNSKRGARNDALTAEVPVGGMDESKSDEVGRLREEVERQRRTIRQLAMRGPKEQYRDDQPMSLGTIPSVSMDSVYDGLLKPLFSRGRQDTSSSSYSELSSLVTELKEENRNLKGELQECRDQADLLEFRILELTEGSDRFSDSDEVSSIKEAEVSSAERPEVDRVPPAPQGDNHPPGEGVHAPHTPEDLSLPLSIDSGLDLTADCKKGRPVGQVSPHTRVSPNTTPVVNPPPVPLPNSGSPPKEMMTEVLPPEPPQLTLLEEPKMETEDGSEVSELAARLQECLSNSHLHEETLLDAINKLRSLDASMNTLQGKVSNLTNENQYLQEALSALSDAHETRTEASGTESEIVNNRKTPSLHSDLSDTESDSASSSSGSEGANKPPRLDTAVSFQESGIFDGPCEVSHIATQTEVDSTTASGPLPPSGQEDLSSAVARLATIKSVVQGGAVHVRLQDEEESSKPLPEDPSMSDFLEIHSQEITELKTALDLVGKQKHDLQLAYDHLQRSVDEETKRRCLESLEVDKGEARALREQLSVSETTRRSLYDEKCELEEAENDARLMVQRLDSQLTAAREMECLLSASLSQEQEISRELHKKVKELQSIEKERSLRQGILERQNQNSVERMASLVMDRDAYASALSFVKNGLLLTQIYKALYLNNPGTLVPYSADSAKNISSNLLEVSGSFSEPSSRGRSACGMVDYALDEALMDISDDSVRCSSGSLLETINSPSEMDFTSSFTLDDKFPVMDLKSPMPYDDFLVPGLCDSSAQTDPVTILEESHMVEAVVREVPVMANVSSVSNVTFIDLQTSNVIDHQPAAKPPTAVEMKSKGTMTVEKDLLSVREKYYLEQIEALQEERMTLRKDQEEQRLSSLHQYQSLEGTIEALQQQLAEREAAQAVLMCQLEEARGEREAACRDLQRRMEGMRGDMARCSDLHEQEKKALRRDFDARLSEVAEERRRYGDRVVELEGQLTALRQELEVVGVAIVSDMATGFDGPPTSSPSCNGGPPSSVAISSGGELLDKIRELIKSESSLRRKISELEKKESAYRVTIDEADKIMHSHLGSYTQRIEELEAANEQRGERVRVLERNEERLRSSLKSSARSEQDSRVAELLQQLLEIEKSELEYKAKLWQLERNEKQLQIKLIEAEKLQQNLRSELRDQEELVQKMTSLQTENSCLSQELNKAHDGVRRIAEVTQSEHFLKGRVEELETSEQGLRDALQQCRAHALQRERKVLEQVTSLEEEIHGYKCQLEKATARGEEAREAEVGLRRQLEAVKGRLEEAETEIKKSSSETTNHEAQLRSEVCKLRSQLKLANTQLSDLEGMSCSLRERLAATEQLRDTLEGQLEERKRRHEGDLLQLNLQVSQKESRLEETEGQLCVLTQLHAAHELDMLASSALAPVLRTAHGLATQLKLCEACSREQSSSLEGFKSQLKTLTDLLNGADQSDGEEGGEESEDEELSELPNLIGTGAQSLEPASTVPTSELDSPTLSLPQPLPSPTPSPSSTPSSHPSLTSQGTPSPRVGSPVPVPAPRRKRKQRREDPATASLRGSFRARKKGNTTILEELEEKVRELEESAAKKEEELKLADSEAAELNSRLTESQQLAEAKEVEVREVRTALSALQEQLVLRIEASEFSKIALESKYKTEEEGLHLRIHALTEQLQSLSDKGRLKDHIIATLVTQIRAILRTTSMGVVVTQIKQVGSRLELAKQRKSQNNQQPSDCEEQEHFTTDFDIENVCQMLDLPQEQKNLSPFEAFITSALLDHLTDVGNASCTSSSKEDSTRSPSSSPSLSTSTLCDQSTQASLQSYLRGKLATHKSRIPKPSPPSDRLLKSASTSTCNNAKTPRSGILARSASTPLVSPLARSSFARSPLVTPVKKINPRVSKPITNTSSSSSTSRSTATKDLNRQRNLQPPISDSRCIKRMITGCVPVRSSVECFASPEFKDNLPQTPELNSTFEIKEPTSFIITSAEANAISNADNTRNPDNDVLPTNRSAKTPQQETSKRNITAGPPTSLPKWRPAGSCSASPILPAFSNTHCKNSEGTGCIPKPEGLRVTRRVGVDGVVIAWNPLDHDCVAGFQVVVEGQVVQQMKFPHRTKALITGLSLSSPCTIGLISVGVDGRSSTPAVVTCDRSSIYQSRTNRRHSAAVPPPLSRKSATPTCI